MAERINNREKSWKDNKNKNIVGINSHNNKILNDFLNDFQEGLNAPKGKKGRRKAGTLLKLQYSVGLILQQVPSVKVELLTKARLHKVFNEMFDGKIQKQSGKDFRDVGDYVKNFKTFWGWMVRTKKAKEDITEDLSQSEYKRGKPAWVYLGHEKVKKLIDSARGDYRALILFLYDSLLRPQEAYRIIVGDFSEDYTTLTIPDKRANGEKVSKTFGRTIKLKQSSQLIKNYVETNKLKSSDFLIIPSQPAFNKYLRTLSLSLFGDGITKARGTYAQLKLYDIRHNSSCFWLDKYKTNKDLMYRAGWLQEDKVLYYSEFLGRRDKIDDEDMMTKEDKTALENELDKNKKDMEELKNYVKNLSGKLIISVDQINDNDSFKQVLEILKEAKKRNAEMLISKK